MRKFALALILSVAIPNTCFGAAAVSLNNYDVNHPIYAWTYGTLAGTDCYVQIFAGRDFNTEVPVMSTTDGTWTFSLSDTPGFFDGGIGIIPGLPDFAQNVVFTAYAWRGKLTADGWATSQDKCAVTWTQNVGASNPPNLPAPATFDFPEGMVFWLPEPAIWALGLIGTAMLLIFRRRRR
jgi:hypothetical protein